MDIQTYLDSLSDDITELDLSDKNLSILPDLSRFTKLEELYCSFNQITEFDNLPNTLKILNCGFNHIKELNNLPITLKYLKCSNNQITQLNNLPKKLKKLICSNNQITQLNNLPKKLKELICSNNQITQFDNLPNTLEILYYENNKIIQFNNLPYTLEILYYENNPLPYFDLGYWKQKTFERKLDEFIKNRSAKIIQKYWSKYWYEPYKYEDNIGICRNAEYGYNEYIKCIQ